MYGILSQKKKLNSETESRTVGVGEVGGDWCERVQTFSYKSIMDLTYSMVTVVDNTVLNTQYLLRE